jgi:hypothetical protein
MPYFVIAHIIDIRMDLTFRIFLGQWIGRLIFYFDKLFVEYKLIASLVFPNSRFASACALPFTDKELKRQPDAVLL